MVDWPRPTTLKSLRGFLGLTGYYRRFIQGYGQISRPLTDLLKKDQFNWGPRAHEAFLKLKSLMTQAPVLALPDFTIPFIIECDASGTGMGAVLMQKGRPICHLYKMFSPRNQKLSAYERELLAIIQACSTWRHYLEGRTFVIRTDHESIKHLLTQKLHTYLQHKGISKLLGLDYIIQYKKGMENKVADALSRQNEDQPHLLAITTVVPNWLKEVQDSYVDDTLASKWIPILTITLSAHAKWVITNGVLYYEGRIYVGKGTELRKKILAEFRNSPIGGHSGILTTITRLQRHFYWPNLIQEVTDWVRECDTCSRCKSENVAYPGHLQALPIPLTCLAAHHHGLH